MLYIVLATIAGLLIGSQPFETSVILLGITFLCMALVVSPLVGLAILLIFVPLRTLILTESSVIPPLDIGILAFLLLAAAWAINRISQKRALLRLYWSQLYIPLAFLLVSVLISGINAQSVSSWITECLKWAFIVLLIAFVFNAGWHWEWVVFALVAAATANAIVGIYIFLGGSGALHLLVENRFFRAFGTFGQPNPFGGFMGLIAPIAVMNAYGHLARSVQVWLKQRQLPGQNVALLMYYSLASLLIIAALFASWSRGAWLGFGISMLVLLFALPSRLCQSFGVVGLATLAIGILWITGLLPQSVVQRVSSATQEIFVLNDVRAVDITPINYPIVERLAHWQAALNMAEDNFWVGVGFGNYEVAYDEYRLLNWREPLGHAHNYYLNVLAEAGIIGLVSYLAAISGFIWISWQSRKHPDLLARCTTIGILGTLSYLVMHSLTDNLYVNNMFFHIGSILGVLAVLHLEVTGQLRVSTE